MSASKNTPGKDSARLARQPPVEVQKTINKLKSFMEGVKVAGRALGSIKCGIYAFFDYEGEPIYVGQTVNRISDRLRRHLTGRRTDSVAKFVLDPFEVLDVHIWPLPEAEALPNKQGHGYAGSKEELVDAAEHTVYVLLREKSKFKAVLNEGLPRNKSNIKVALPEPRVGRIVPDDLMNERLHPDVRIARRAQTMASLAKLIAERNVKRPLRATLHVQTRRLEVLARRRLDDFPKPKNDDEEFSSSPEKDDAP